MLMEANPGTVSALLHRACTTLAATYHPPERAAASPRHADQETRQMLARYVHVWETADVVGLLALSKEEAVLAMPLGEAWYAGRRVVGEFVAGTVLADDGMFGGLARGRWRLLPCAASGEAGFGLYRRVSEGGHAPLGLSVISLLETQVAAVTIFLDPRLPTRFGLPAKIT